MPFVSPVAVAPLDGRITTGTADGGRAGGTGRAGPRHMDLIDGVERVGGMPGQHVREARREAAAWRDEDAGATCRLVELEHCADARGVVDGRREGDAGRDGALRARGDERGRKGGGDRVHTRGERVVGTQLDGLGALTERRGDVGGVRGPARRDQQRVEAGGVDQLASGSDSDRSDPVEQDGDQRVSGSRGLRARASRRWWEARPPCRAASRTRRRGRRSRRRSDRGEAPSWSAV